jgi:hypothetical protein
MRASALIQTLVAVMAAGVGSDPVAADSGTPLAWSTFTRVEGQALPVPDHWLKDEEARIAYSLRLPESVPRPQPFDFTAAWWRAWLPGTPRVAVQYFDHLCRTEAGQWIFRTERDVPGLYFARPQGMPSYEEMTEPYGPEMPWIQSIFMLTGDNAHDQGAWFVQPPRYNYRFVEQPRRDVGWQAGINERYVRLFGYTRGYFVKPGQVVAAWNEITPMQAIGTASREARFGYTWRGLRRVRDREHGIAGGEVLIYDLQTREVLAVRRQFLIASKNPRGSGNAMWEVATRCSQLRTLDGIGLEFNRFAFEVLQTTPLSNARSN